MNLGDLVRRKRERLGITARALSLQAGQSASYVTKLERGLIQPSFRAFARLAVALSFSPLEVVYAVAQEAKAPDSPGETPE